MAFIRKLDVAERIFLLIFLIISIAMVRLYFQENDDVFLTIGILTGLFFAWYLYFAYSDYSKIRDGMTLSDYKVALARYTLSHAEDARSDYERLGFRVEEADDSDLYYQVVLTRGCRITRIGEQLAITRQEVPLLTMHTNKFGAYVEIAHPDYSVYDVA